MWPVSGRFDSALRVSHEVVSVAEVWRGTVRQNLPDGTSLLFDEGTVTVDESSKVRRQLSLRTSNVSLNPVVASDLFSAPDVDIKVWSGIRYTEGDTELVPVGVFRVSDVSKPNYLGDITILGGDYAEVLIDARFPSPWATPSGTSIPDEIARMAKDAIPALTVINLTGSRSLTTAAPYDRDRWDAMLSLAKSIGAEVFFDQVGRLIIRPVPQVAANGPGVWTVDAGRSTSDVRYVGSLVIPQTIPFTLAATTAVVTSATSTTAVMVDVATSVSNKRVYNGVVASSSAQGVTVSGAAYLAFGPLAYTAGFKRTRFYASPMLYTVEQCQAAAVAILARSAVFSRQISPVSAPNPALDAGDPLRLVLPPDGNGIQVSETRILSKFTLPLKMGPMPLETRIGIDALTTSDVGSLA